LTDVERISPVKSEPKAFASLSSGLLARKGAARPAMRPQGFGQGGSGLEDLGWNDMGYDSPKPSLVPVGEADVAQISRNPLAGLTPVSPVHDQQAEIEQRFTGYDAGEDELGEEFEDEADETAAMPFASLAGGYEAEAEEQAEEEPDTLELADEFSEDEADLPEAMPVVAVVDAHAPLVPFASAFARPQIQAESEPEFEPEPEFKPEFKPEMVEEPAPAPAVAPPPVVVFQPAAKPVERTETSAKGKAAFTLRLDPSRHLKLRLACAVTGRSAQQLVTRALDEYLASMPELEAMAERAPAERVSRKGTGR
jgi:hypothetical protein